MLVDVYYSLLIMLFVLLSITLVLVKFVSSIKGQNLVAGVRVNVCQK